MTVEEMLKPVSSSSRAGENLEYDPLYLSLPELAAEVPPQAMGEEVAGGRDPDWRKLKANSLEVWSRTRDLRVAVYYTVACAVLEGLPGLCRGLELIDGLVREYWDDCHPQLDPDDDFDPTERINILAMLSPAAGAYSDPVMFTARLRAFRLAEGSSLTLRDAMSAGGLLEIQGKSVDPAFFHAEMLGLPVEAVRANYALVQKAQKLVEDIESTMNERMQGRGYISLETLAKELKHFERVYAQYAHAQNSAEASAQAEESQALNHACAAREAAAVSRKAQPVCDLSAFRPASRAEALLLLKKSAEYFQLAEPTSPVPFLINRALRMAEMNFMDLLAEIDPNALERGREQLGVPKAQDEC